MVYGIIAKKISDAFRHPPHSVDILKIIHPFPQLYLRNTLAPGILVKLPLAASPFLSAPTQIQLNSISRVMRTHPVRCGRLMMGVAS